MRCSKCGGEHQNEGGKYPACVPPIQFVTLDKRDHSSDVGYLRQALEAQMSPRATSFPLEVCLALVLVVRGWQ